MNQLDIFNYQDQQVRTIADENGEPWFVASDLAKILGLKNSRDAIGRLDPDGVGNADIIDSLGRNQVARTVNESGLYELIFQSRVPSAQDFKRWVTREVLPSIRRTGSYGAPAALSNEEIVARALQITTAQVAALEATVKEQAPKVEFFDDYVSHDDAMTVKDWGAQFGVGERRARELLVDANIIYRKHIGRRWSDSAGKLVDEYEYRARDGRVTYDWFTLRGQHKVKRHHNGQLRQTLYVRGDKALELAKKVGVATKQTVLEVA